MKVYTSVSFGSRRSDYIGTMFMILPGHRRCAKYTVGGYAKVGSRSRRLVWTLGSEVKARPLAAFNTTSLDCTVSSCDQKLTQRKDDYEEANVA